VGREERKREKEKKSVKHTLLLSSLSHLDHLPKRKEIAFLSLEMDEESG
jgi:hypothetical protein